MTDLARRLVSLMPSLTVQRSASAALENARLNLPYIRRSIVDLETAALRNNCHSAIVIAAGPSLYRNDPARVIKESGFKGVIVATESALYWCLRNGIIPQFVVTLDPHPHRIVRCFGDLELESREDDGYFRRQELDPNFGVNELTHNQELIDLVNRHGQRIKVVISTSASQSVTQRCLSAGMELYWWNPIFDDFTKPESLTRWIHQLNRVPCMVSGGNSGTAAWVFAHQVLWAKRIALVGMDMGYTPDTPLGNTQYYKEIRGLFGRRAKEAFIHVYNPYLKETWFTDPAYYWYRQSLLRMIPRAQCTTFNCTEGGILFGKGIRFVKLRRFLADKGLP